MRINSVALRAKADYENTRVYYNEALRVAHETTVHIDELLLLHVRAPDSTKDIVTTHSFALPYKTRKLLYIFSDRGRAYVRTLKNDRLLVLSYISILQSADPAQYSDYHRLLGMIIAHAASIETVQLGDAFGAHTWAQRASVEDVSRGHTLISPEERAGVLAIKS